MSRACMLLVSCLLRLQLGSGYDTVLYVLDSCGGAELACVDDPFSIASQVQISLAAGQTVIVVVDGAGTSNGDFVLNVQ